MFSPIGTSAPLSDRPTVLSDADKQCINFPIKRNSFMKIEYSCKSLYKPVFVHTVARALKSYGYVHWKARKRSQLNEEIAKPYYHWVFASKD